MDDDGLESMTCIWRQTVTAHLRDLSYMRPPLKRLRRRFTFGIPIRETEAAKVSVECGKVRGKNNPPRACCDTQLPTISFVLTFRAAGTCRVQRACSLGSRDGNDARAFSIQKMDYTQKCGGMSRTESRVGIVTSLRLSTDLFSSGGRLWSCAQKATNTCILKSSCSCYVQQPTAPTPNYSNTDPSHPRSA